MKENTQKSYLFLIIAIVLAVAGYCAVRIGNKLSAQKTYDNLSIIVGLSLSLQEVINNVQKERALTSMFLFSANEEFNSRIKDQAALTNLSLKKFGELIVIDRVLFMTINESDLHTSMGILQAYRKQFTVKTSNLEANFSFYTEAVDYYTSYLKQMYDFNAVLEVKDEFVLLADVAKYKEALSQESGYLASLLSKGKTSSEELAFMKENFKNQNEMLNKLRMIKDPDLQKTLQDVSDSPELKHVLEYRKAFNEGGGQLSGSFEKSLDYFQKSSDLIAYFSTLEGTLTKRIGNFSREALSRLFDETIKTTLYGLLGILIPLGIFVFIKRFKTT